MSKFSKTALETDAIQQQWECADAYAVRVMVLSRPQLNLMFTVCERVENNEFETEARRGHARHLRGALEGLPGLYRAVRLAHKRSALQGLARALYLYHACLWSACSEYTQITELVIY